MRRLPFHADHLMLLLAVAIGLGTCATTWGADALSKADVNKILKEPGLLAAQKAEFDAYFTKEFFPQFSSSNGSSDKYVKLRKDLRIFLNWGKQGAAHDELNKLTMSKMKETVLSPKADSASKVNAMLVIGELNEIDDAAKPKPLGEAFKILYAVVAIQSPKFGDELRVAAMVGLERWVHLGAIPAAQKADVTKVMVGLVNQKDPPPNRSRDGHYWLRHQAMQMLAKMGETGPNNSVVNALTAVAGDENARFTLRCEAVQCLGQLKYSAGAKVDFEALTKSLAHDMIDICNVELAEAKAVTKPPSRKVLIYTLYSAREGIAGLQEPSSGTPQKKYVSEVADKLKKIHAELDSPEVADDLLAAEAGKKLAELVVIVGPKPATEKDSTAKKEVASADGKEKPAESVKQ